MSHPVSPLAPAAFPDMPHIDGVRMATLATGIRYKGRPDALLVEFAPGTSVAGVFTRSLTAAAPVLWSRKILKQGTARAVLVNAGNANAFTGKAGEVFLKASVTAAAKALRCKISDIFAASTGVIGQPMPQDALARHVPDLAKNLGQASWRDAVAAIMTTDTYAKGATRTAKIDGKTVTLAGIAKGSGMIAPDMATMLAFVFTDAAISPAALQKMLAAANAKTFNCITVDGDTSTNDTLLLAATGQADHKPVKSATDPRATGFIHALEDLLRDLAQQIVKDGEGATKFVTITVKGAASDQAARTIAMTVANSPLVKTALAGEDANWGRIVAAIGRAGEKAERDKIKIRIGGTLICARGMQVPNYDEAPVAAHMRGAEIVLAIDLGLNQGTATVWTCDLTHGYIDINGSYRS